MVKSVCCLMTAVAFLLPLAVWAADFPEAVSGIPEPGQTIAFSKSITVDGNLSDWNGAAWIIYDQDHDVMRGGSDMEAAWAVLYDDSNFYFAAAVKDDDVATSATWFKTDVILLFFDWESNGTRSALLQFNHTGAFNGPADLTEASSLIVTVEETWGDGGKIYELSIPFEKALANVNMTPAEGGTFKMIPGFADGSAAGQEAVFMSWLGANVDNCATWGETGVITFAGLMAVAPHAAKLATTWGYLRSR